MKPLNIVAWILLTIIAIVGLASFAAPKDDTVPVGTIMAWAGEKGSVPADWMICDGKALKINQYKDLYNAIGWSWGKPAAKRFNLPDLRGRFMRGVDDGADLDPDADDREAAAKGGNTKGVGSVQDDAVQDHAHYQLEHSHSYRYYTTHVSYTLGPGTYMIPAGSHGGSYFSYTETTTTAPAISGVIKYKTKSAIKKAEETRPKNAGVYFIIKVK